METIKSRLFSIMIVLTLLIQATATESKRSKYFIAIKKYEENGLKTLSTYVPFSPPANKFYADPMLFKYKEINYVFFEDYDYEKGVISYITVDLDLNFSQPRKALELPIHLSFPYVFQEGNEIYMTPETYDYQSISLFRATEFPSTWVHERILIQGQNFSDPILFKHDGYYWLFTCIKGDRLCIYYAKDLQGYFHPHPINQQFIRGRNAGAIYTIDNRLIRPTMDCRKGYGKSMILKEILILNPDTFKERDIAYIKPNWAPYLIGTHTYCQNEDLIVYDGKQLIISKTP